MTLDLKNWLGETLLTFHWMQWQSFIAMERTTLFGIFPHLSFDDSIRFSLQFVFNCWLAFRHFFSTAPLNHSLQTLLNPIYSGNVRKCVVILHFFSNLISVQSFVTTRNSFDGQMRQYVLYAIFVVVLMFVYIRGVKNFLVAFDWLVPSMCMQVSLDSLFKRLCPTG